MKELEELHAECVEVMQMRSIWRRWDVEIRRRVWPRGWRPWLRSRWGCLDDSVMRLDLRTRVSHQSEINTGKQEAKI